MNAPAAPLTLGRYVLHAQLASGGIATIHFGRLSGQAGFARTVAIKRLHPLYAQDSEFVRMFLDEARIASRVRHPNVMPTIDVVAEGNELFLVMDYVHGESLAKLHKRARAIQSPMSPAIIAGIMGNVTLGLHAAHEARDEHGTPLEIIHRDVSPQNVIVGVDGAARVLDFGIAKAQGRLHATRSGALKGKLAYMAPEQLAGEQATRRIDIYACGVVLWELLVGRKLFAASSEFETAQLVLKGDIPHPTTQMDPAEPPPTAEHQRLGDVAMRALSRNPSARYATAKEMAFAIEDVVLPASQARVGAWVEVLAAEVLSVRAQVLAIIEDGDSSADLRVAANLVARLAASGEATHQSSSDVSINRNYGPTSPRRPAVNFDAVPDSDPAPATSRYREVVVTDLQPEAEDESESTVRVSRSTIAIAEAARHKGQALMLNSTLGAGGNLAASSAASPAGNSASFTPALSPAIEPGSLSKPRSLPPARPGAFNPAATNGRFHLRSSSGHRLAAATVDQGAKSEIAPADLPAFTLDDEDEDQDTFAMPLAQHTARIAGPKLESQTLAFLPRPAPIAPPPPATAPPHAPNRATSQAPLFAPMAVPLVSAAQVQSTPIMGTAATMSPAPIAPAVLAQSTASQNTMQLRAQPPPGPVFPTPSFVGSGTAPPGVSVPYAHGVRVPPYSPIILPTLTDPPKSRAWMLIPVAILVFGSAGLGALYMMKHRAEQAVIEATYRATPTTTIRTGANDTGAAAAVPDRPVAVPTTAVATTPTATSTPSAATHATSATSATSATTRVDALPKIQVRIPGPRPAAFDPATRPITPKVVVTAVPVTAPTHAAGDLDLHN